MRYGKQAEELRQNKEIMKRVNEIEKIKRKYRTDRDRDDNARRMRDPNNRNGH
jgi:hypothetical protein